jgi:hypothetical protein
MIGSSSRKSLVILGVRLESFYPKVVGELRGDGADEWKDLRIAKFRQASSSNVPGCSHGT